MKNFSLLFILAYLLLVAPFSRGQQNSGRINDILGRIQPASFPADTFNIAAFGAKNDGVSDSRQAIINAIDAASRKGGGVVMLPPGTYYCAGPISLKSNVNLHIGEGATLLFSPEPAHYLPAVFTRWECIELYNYSPMIYTSGQENVAITGKGTIDGNALANWVPFRPKQGPAQNRARDMGDKQVPLSERIFGEGDYLRPSFVQFINCHRILVEGVTLVNSPLWMLHPVYCTNFIFRDLTFTSMIINNDGIDVDSSETGLIEGCTFNTGDDAVVFKSGRDRDGWRVGKPSKDIVVRNCHAPQALHGIAFGSEMSGGIENVYILNFSLGKVKSEAIQFKANKDRGGYIRDIYISDITVEEAGNHLFYFTNSYHSYRGGNAPSAFYNIKIENVKCGSAKNVIQLQGIEGTPLRNITINNVTVGKAENVFGKREFYENVTFSDFVVAGKKIDHPF